MSATYQRFRTSLLFMRWGDVFLKTLMTLCSIVVVVLSVVLVIGYRWNLSPIKHGTLTGYVVQIEEWASTTNAEAKLLLSNGASRTATSQLFGVTVTPSLLGEFRRHERDGTQVRVSYSSPGSYWAYESRSGYYAKTVEPTGR